MAGDSFKRFSKPAPKPGAKRKGGNPNPSPATRHIGNVGHGWTEGTSGNPGGVPVYRYEALQKFCQKLLKFVEAKGPEGYRVAIDGWLEGLKIAAAKAADATHPEQLEATKYLGSEVKDARVYALGHVPKESTINLNTTSQVNVRPVDLPGMITELTVFEKRTQMIHAVMEEERAALIEATSSPAEPNGEAPN